jgi:hypothetical protein
MFRKAIWPSWIQASTANSQPSRWDSISTGNSSSGIRSTSSGVRMTRWPRQPALSKALRWIGSLGSPSSFSSVWLTRLRNRMTSSFSCASSKIPTRIPPSWARRFISALSRSSMACPNNRGLSRSTALIAPAHSTVSSNSGMATSTPMSCSVCAISNELSLRRSKFQGRYGMPCWVQYSSAQSGATTTYRRSKVAAASTAARLQPSRAT